MSLKLPNELAAKTYAFPESSYGATTVTLVLSDGRRIPDVIIGGETIVKVKDRLVSVAGDLDFRVSEIVDVLPQTRLFRVRLIVEALARALRRS